MTILSLPVRHDLAARPRRRQHSGAAERAYEALLDAVLGARLPLGLRIREDALAEELRVSRTPVHEALLRLFGEGLIARHRDGGFTPLVPSVSAVRELIEVRAVLERTALTRPRLAGETHDPRQIAQIRDRWLGLAERPPRPEEFVAEDHRFHVDAAHAAGNPALSRALQGVLLQIRALSSSSDAWGEREVLTSIDEHLELIDLLVAGDVDAAVAAFDEHLARALANVPDRVAGTLAAMSGAR